MSQTTTPSGAEILGALDNAIRPLNRPRKQSEFNELFKARAAVAALIARNAELEAEREVAASIGRMWSKKADQYKAERDALAAENKALREALVMFREAKTWVASDSWDGIDQRGRELMEEADVAACAALARTPAKENDDE